RAAARGRASANRCAPAVAVARPPGTTPSPGAARAPPPPAGDIPAARNPLHPAAVDGGADAGDRVDGDDSSRYSWRTGQFQPMLVNLYIHGVIGSALIVGP